MKPVHRESNLDVDYVISYKIPSDGGQAPQDDIGSKLTFSQTERKRLPNSRL